MSEAWSAEITLVTPCICKIRNASKTQARNWLTKDFFSTEKTNRWSQYAAGRHLHNETICRADFPQISGFQNKDTQNLPQVSCRYQLFYFLMNKRATPFTV